MLPQEWMPIVNLGAVGAVLLWFMFRAEKRLEGIATSVDRLSKTMLLAIVGNPVVTEPAKVAARNLLAEIEAKLNA